MKLWKALAPIALAIVLAVIPPPDGLPQHAWWYFAIFAGVILGLVLEPLPGGAIGLIGVAVVTVLAPFVYLAPDALAKAGSKWPAEAIRWALSGFSNTTVWLIFGAFMFALGYEKTGLGRRIALVLVKLMGRRTLTLGYAVTVADTVLAPFTPSNTARSAGTIFPVIRNLPGLYDSKPNDPSASRIGTYLMWTALATTCVTSSMFLTGLAPNLLALELAQKTAKVSVTWGEWLQAFLPVGVVLLILVPLLTWVLAPPAVKSGNEVPTWAGKELEKMGKLSSREIELAILVLLALALWIFGGSFIDATTVALVTIALMLITGVVSWDDVISNKQAWNTLAWFATLVALAAGLSQVGFVKWLAGVIGAHMTGFEPVTVMIVLVLAFYFLHYMFASITAHVTALLPVFLSVGAAMPGLDMKQYTVMLLMTLGIMGILTPYATGPSPVYYGSGYIPSSKFWLLGAIFGVVFIAALMIIGLPWVRMIFGAA
jgi:L-tartrate/succinate antiporter